MLTITAPGVEINELDLSFYDFPQPKEETQNVLINGFATQGHTNSPYKFTSKNSEDDLIKTFGTPTNEAERYFFNACSEAIKRDKVVLYANRLPYSNNSTNNFNCVEYTLNKGALVLSALDGISADFRKEPDGQLSDYRDLLALKTILDADSTLSSQYLMEISCSNLKTYSAEQVEQYRTSVRKPASGKFLIIDKNQEIYGKIPQDAKHMTLSSRYMLGVLPIVTTATNAMYYQNLIAHSLVSTETTYLSGSSDDLGALSALSVVDIYAVSSYATLSINESGHPVSGEYSGSNPKQFFDSVNPISAYPELCSKLLCSKLSSFPIDNLSVCETLNPTSKMFGISVVVDDILSGKEYIKDPESAMSSIGISAIGTDERHASAHVIAAFQYGKRIVDILSCMEPTDSISSSTVAVDQTVLVNPASSRDLDPDNKDALTISKYAMGFFPTIDIQPDGSFARDRLTNIGVVVFKGFVDAESGNKVKYEPVEAFAGSLKSDDVDPTTGASRFIDDIINTNSQTIEFYSNCFNSRIPATNDISGYAKLNNPGAASTGGRESIDTLFKSAKRSSKKTDLSSYQIEAQPFAAFQPTTPTVPDVGTIEYSDLGLLHINAKPSFTIGFKELDAKEKSISYSQIMSSLDKVFEKNKSRDEMQIDLVVDAGVANIADFMYLVNGKHDINDEAESVWLKNYDPTAYQDDDESTPALNETKSAVALWDICTRVGDGSASVAKDGAVEKWALVQKKYDAFCKLRGDCMFIADGLRPLCICGNRKRVTKNNFNSTVVKTINPFMKYITGKIDTSYGCGNCDWYQIVDPTSGVNMWMPPSVKMMCSMLDTTNAKFYWTIPVGVNNGKMNPVDNPSKVKVIDIAFSPTTQDAGDIYTKSWNYAKFYEDDGFVLEGQRTFQSRPTAFDRINVRRLFLYLERKVYNSARYFIYEGNTAYTRQRLVDAITPYFEDAKINGGLHDYRIVCDETNNTQNSIDRNELHVKVAIKPTKAIEFIECTFVALRTGASFTEAGMKD